MLKRVLLAGFIVFAVLFLSVLPEAAHALTTGDYCWKVTENQKTPFTVKLHLVKSADPNVGTVSGLLTAPDSSTVVITGTYFQSGINVYLNISMTQRHTSGSREVQALQAILDSTKQLSGTFFRAGTEYISSTKTSELYGSGAFTRITCQ